MRSLTDLEYRLLHLARIREHTGKECTPREERAWNDVVARGLATAQVHERCCSMGRHLHLHPTAAGLLALRCTDAARSPKFL
jgi:hypothetical protein